MILSFIATINLNRISLLACLCHLQILDHDMERDFIILKEILDSVQTGMRHVDVNREVTGDRMSPKVQLDDDVRIDLDS